VSEIAHRIEQARERIAGAAQRSGRDPGDVMVLLAVKARSIAEVEEAYRAGVRDFGENRAEELRTHAAALPDDVRWHFIGTVQRRKVRIVRPRVVLLHSLDRPKLADAWAGDGPPPPALVEVNIGREPQKHGVMAEDAAGLVDHAAALGIPVTGLMTVPPFSDDPEDARPHFRALAGLAAELGATRPGLTQLSMGMSDDFEVAVEEGATVVRLGRAIFGPR
jgi:pyridoxal phosphate enzyme (YggS family)